MEEDGDRKYLSFTRHAQLIEAAGVGHGRPALRRKPNLVWRPVNKYNPLLTAHF